MATRIQRLLCLAVLMFSFSAFARAEAGKVNILQEKYASEGVAGSFKVGTDWYPFPAYSDRKAWTEMIGSDNIRNYVAAGEKYLGFNWHHIAASTFLLPESSDNKGLDRVNRKAFISLAMAELAEGKGRFLPDIANGYWFYCNSGHWYKAGRTAQKLPDLENHKLDLSNVRASSMLCSFWPLFKDALDETDPQINPSFKAAVKTQILDTFLNMEYNPWWLGGPTVARRLNNWTPWCCSDVMLSFFVVEDDQERLDKALRRALPAVDEFLGDIPQDGLCEEGPTYWFHSVGRTQEFLRLLYDASGGKFDILPNDFIAKMGLFISKCYMAKGRKGQNVVANYGDAGPYMTLDPYVLWHCAEGFGLPELKNLALYGSWTGKKFKTPSMENGEGYRALQNAKVIKEIMKEMSRLNYQVKNGENVNYILYDLQEKTPSVTWYPLGQQCFIKTYDGWSFSGKASFNAESHNHNDSGSCILYIDGVPVFVDSGTGSYGPKTFGPERYTLWTMQSEWHNVPVINGVPQKAGNQYRTKDVNFTTSKDRHVLTCDMAGAYPKSSDCDSWVRTYTLTTKRKVSQLEITDTYSLKSRKGSDVEHFLIHGEAKCVKPGVVVITSQGRRFELTYPAGLLEFSTDVQTDLNKGLKKYWGESLTRINLTSAPDAPLSGTYTLKIRAL